MTDLQPWIEDRTPFNCIWCGKRFIGISPFMWHLEKDHKDKWDRYHKDKRDRG